MNNPFMGFNPNIPVSFSTFSSGSGPLAYPYMNNFNDNNYFNDLNNRISSLEERVKVLENKINDTDTIKKSKNEFVDYQNNLYVM